jgi:phage RecT family recombinase
MNDIKQPTKTNIEISIDDYAPNLVPVLPPDISLEMFKRVLITAMNAQPDLVLADRRSLFVAVQKCAGDGLLPDGREAALVVFNTKVKNKRTGATQYIKKVEYIPMIFGIRKRMRNSGEVLSATAEVIFAKDKFAYRLGDEASIEHIPAVLGNDRGKQIGAYAIIKLRNGEVLREVMSIADIERVRAISRSKDGPAWVNWYEEMARKSVLKRCAKGAPVSPRERSALARHEADDDQILLPQAPQQQLAPPVDQTPPRPTRQEVRQEVERKPEPEPAREDDEYEEVDEGEGGDVALEVHDQMTRDERRTVVDTDAPRQRDEAFWKRRNYIIDMPLSKEGIASWPEWKTLFVQRVAEAQTREELANLDADNREKMQLLQHSAPNLHGIIRESIRLHAGQLAQ